MGAPSRAAPGRPDQRAAGQELAHAAQERGRAGHVAKGQVRRQGVLVLGDANDNWVHARGTWNQWLYNPAYINEDSSIPPSVGAGVQNHLREQLPIAGVDPFAAPDLSVSRVTVDAVNCAGPAGIIARVGNGGSLQAGAGIAVDFYLSDPAAGGNDGAAGRSAGRGGGTAPGSCASRISSATARWRPCALSPA